MVVKGLNGEMLAVVLGATGWGWNGVNDFGKVRVNRVCAVPHVEQAQIINNVVVSPLIISHIGTVVVVVVVVVVMPEV